MDNNLIDHIELADGFNINPVSLEFGNSMTTTKFLLSLQSKINKIIDMGNAWEQNANDYTNEKKDILQKEIDELNRMITTGDIIPDGSLKSEKIDKNFLQDIKEIALRYIRQSAKFVSFGLDDDGNFIAIIPDTWNDILFSTSVDGRLCLNVDEKEVEYFGN